MTVINGIIAQTGNGIRYSSQNGARDQTGEVYTRKPGMGIKQAIGNWLRVIGPAVAMGWQRLVCAVANFRRRLLRKRLADYAVFLLDHEISERAPDVPWWYAYIPGLKLPLSLEYLSDALHRIAGDPDIRGVIFLMKGPSLSLAQAQSLSMLFQRFRTQDGQFRRPDTPAKQVIVHLEQLSAATYVVACAADRVTMTPLTSWDVLGLRVAPVYLKDTLARAGIQFDVVKIAPWKTAADTFSRTDMSEAERAQYNWLLDSLSEDIQNAIAAGRRLTAEEVQAAVNQAPLTAEQAQAARLVDDIAYEDELPALLAGQAKPPQLKPYAKVRGLLLRRPRPRHPRAIGVLSLQGSIITGESRSFPVPLPVLGGHFIGSNTVEQQVRAARKDDSLAAVIVHIDSGGGSALASDLMWRELKLLSREKPLIVYMGNVAASGGYYIAAPGAKIVAQSATLTGSIGVVTAKPVTAAAFAKVGAHRETIQRGDNANLYSEDSAWTPAQRQKVEDGVRYVYHVFKQRVAEGRSLPYETLDDVCNGRVWTGKQALVHGLVDVLGDFQTALDLACQAAALPTDGSVCTTLVTAPKSRLVSEPVAATQALLGLSTIHQLGQLGRLAAAAVTGDWEALWGQDPYWLIADGLPKIG